MYYIITRCIVLKNKSLSTTLNTARAKNAYTVKLIDFLDFNTLFAPNLLIQAITTFN